MFDYSRFCSNEWQVRLRVLGRKAEGRGFRDPLEPNGYVNESSLYS